MIIDCVSDLHGYLPELPGGDLLIVAGDLTGRDTKAEYVRFTEWYLDQKYRKKVLIAGNHDNCIQSGDYYFNHEWLGYLCDSGTEFEGLKIWGSPWTSQFPGINPHCCAFTEPFMTSLKHHWDKIPNDIDILVTHSPPFGVMDQVKTEYCASVGDKHLLEASENRVRPRLHVFGHIHENGGKKIVYKRPGFGEENNTIFVNASIVDERYRNVNKPVRIILEGTQGFRKEETPKGSL